MSLFPGNHYCVPVWLLQGDFREENFNTAMTILKDAGSSDGGKDQRGRRGGTVG